MNHLSSEIGVFSTELTKVETLALSAFKNEEKGKNNSVIFNKVFTITEIFKQISSITKMKKITKIKTEKNDMQTKKVLKIKKELLQSDGELKEASNFLRKKLIIIIYMFFLEIFRFFKKFKCLFMHNF